MVHMANMKPVNLNSSLGRLCSQLGTSYFLLFSEKPTPVVWFILSVSSSSLLKSSPQLCFIIPTQHGILLKVKAMNLSLG